MFCSLCRNVDQQLVEMKRKICDVGHIYCNLCDKNLENCIVCGQKISNYIQVEFNENIPRISYTAVNENRPVDENVPLEINNDAVDSDDSDLSCQEMLKELNDYENCCNKAKCEKKPIIGCVEVIGHIPETSSVSVSLDEDDEREILKQFCRKSTVVPEKCQNEKVPSNKATKTSSISVNPTASSRRISRGNSIIKSSQSAAFVANESSLIVNKPSTPTVYSESQTSHQTVSSRSACCSDEEKSVIVNCDPGSVRQIFRNEKCIKESEIANFTSLGTSRLEISPPEKNSKIPYNACRAKFAPVYHCDYNYPAQMEPIEHYETDKNNNEELEKLALSLPRLPVPCPCSFCGIVTTPTDFFSHITIDHPYVETVKLAPRKVFNCSFCLSGNLNLVRCHRMFLLNGKLTDIGHGPFKNCLPILLLSCKLNLRDIFGSSTLQNQRYNNTEDILCIWLASVFQFPVQYTLNIWRHGRDKTEGNFIKSISTTSSCLNVKHSNLELATSVMSLSHTEYQKVTSDDNLINCQVLFN